LALDFSYGLEVFMVRHTVTKKVVGVFYCVFVTASPSEPWD
jgi:hypothetical protein